MPRGKYSGGRSAWRYARTIKDFSSARRLPMHAYRTSSRSLSAFWIFRQQPCNRWREFYALKEKLHQIIPKVAMPNSTFFCFFYDSMALGYRSSKTLRSSLHVYLLSDCGRYSRRAPSQHQHQWRKGVSNHPHVNPPNLHRWNTFMRLKARPEYSELRIPLLKQRERLFVFLNASGCLYQYGPSKL